MPLVKTSIVLTVLACPTMGLTQNISSEEARAAIFENAENRRQAMADMSFEDYKSSLTYFEDIQAWIIDGDIVIRSEKRLRDFFDRIVKSAPRQVEAGDVEELIQRTVGGLSIKWSSDQKNDLTYCVSTYFEGAYDKVVSAAETATAAWEASADIDFRHMPQHDASCSANNSATMFNIAPANFAGQYWAVAFFPDAPRSERLIYVDPVSLNLPVGASLTLDGILKHELGHVLGFRHEHIRPDSGCQRSEEEMFDWQRITDPDEMSVMHYPCDDTWHLELSHADQNGAACVYGAAVSFEIDMNVCKPLSAPDLEAPDQEIDEIAPLTVLEGVMEHIRTYKVRGGGTLAVAMSGSGDADLHVRFGSRPKADRFDCRPYRENSDEICLLDIPQNAEFVVISVRGFAASSVVQLRVTGAFERN